MTPSHRSGHDWKALQIAGTPRRGEFSVLESGIEVEGGAVLIGLDAGGFYHVLVPSTGIHIQPDYRSAGVQLLGRKLDDPGTEAAEFVDVACRKAHLSGIFIHLAEDLLARIEEAPEDPVGVCRRVLARWRELLDREAPHVLSRDALAGLFGELKLLSSIMPYNSAALDTWTGPVSSIHDFTREPIAVEVKTSFRREGWLFEIHGHRQLEAPPVEGGELYLAAIKVEQSSAGISVPALIDEICELGVDRLDLHSKLLAVGYDTRDAEVYRDMPFRATEERVYRVNDAFPRLVSSSFSGGEVPAGILHLRYTIDLTAAPIPTLDTPAWNEVVRRLAGSP